MSEQVIPLGAVTRGLLAGVADAAAVTAWQELLPRFRFSGEESEGFPTPWRRIPARRPRLWHRRLLASYAKLVPMGLYKPPWTYASAELATDPSFHLTYGTGTAVVYRSSDPERKEHRVRNHP